MPAPFKKVNLEQFAGILERFPFTRSVNAVHMHHTWRPNHQQFRGHDSIESMFRYHTEHNGWSDIAQHITIDPHGDIWLGRNWNSAPASASGHNGNAKAGPFMFEMIGDFDAGRDRFAGAQRDTVLSVIALVQQRFDLRPESLVFHNAMSGKSCPGSSINYADTVDAVRQTRASMAVGRRAAPFQSEAYESRQVIDAALHDLARPAPEQRADAEADACLHHHGYAQAEEAYRGMDGIAARAPTLTAPQAQALKPHLVNLSMGEFSDSGEWSTTPADVDAIFGTHLPRAMQEARKEGRPLRLMFQAHGGLNDEATGLAIAQKSVAWWLANGVYPIYFTWETGLFETIGQLLRRAGGEGARDLADYTSDPLVQETVRLLQAPKIWGGMKLSAQLASGKEGGAFYVAKHLAAFCQAHRDEVELHAVGHSAGSIFHSWFIPCALDLGAPPFRSLHLMAPAVRVDLFKEKLAPRVGPGRGIDDITVYTMKDALEEDDSCAGIYRKSLLYLIFHALEPQRKTPILGLEDSLRADRDTSRMFGLDGGAAQGQVIWSRTQASTGRSASNATSHGGFDDDPATMGSIVRRILDRQDHEPIVEYQSGARGTGWEQLASADAIVANEQRQKPAADHIQIGAIQPAARRALCVGINTYPTAPLSGCVADVEAWSKTLAGAGFSVTRLLDARATRSAIIDNLERMIAASRKGDVLVFQYSGHGTQVPDLDRDEERGDSPGLDEAICPHDFATGALLIDDDIARIFRRLPDGVNLTCFMDCCHSGTISRFAVGGPPANGARDPSEHMRFVPATRELAEAHRNFRAGLPMADDGERGAVPLREVVFSACLSTEVAWESNGQGEFTVRATAVLAEGMDGLTNSAFADKVSAAFGARPRQHAKLYSNAQASSRLLLQPLGSAPAIKEAVETSMTPTAVATPDLAQLMQVLQNVERLLMNSQLQMPKMVGKPGRKNGLQNLPTSASMQHGGKQNR
jgi:hypothetical protein